MKTTAVDDDIVYTKPIKANEDILELVQSSKNIIDGDPNDENEMNNVLPVPTSSQMRNIIESMRRYLDAHSNGKMNNKMKDVAKRQCKENISDYFP
ncbi:hypothetical protein TNCV_2265721 [Trichonephila clavipes]|nr:hypothetical protein TNCV_2265721 [Trichonephila clavipes]